MAQARPGGLIGALDDASLSRFHLRAVFVAGMGFFTDAYDLFIIGVASTLIKQDWHLDTGRLALLSATMLEPPAWAPCASAGSPTWSAASGCTGCSRP
jgi:MFS transporter, PHS family, inorganic phosphate transporter